MAIRRPIYQATSASITLGAATEVDLIGSATKPLDLGNCSVFEFGIFNADASNAIDTVTIYLASSAGGQLIAQTTTYSIAAVTKVSFRITGTRGMVVRLTGQSVSGASAQVDYAGIDDGLPQQPFDIFVGSVRQGQGVGGTIAGNLSQSGGTATINATGAVAIDSSTTVKICGTTGAPTVGRTAQSADFPGGLTVADTKAITGAGDISLEAAAAKTVTIGRSSNAVSLGQAGKTTSVLGKLVLSQGVVGEVTTPSAGDYAAAVTDFIIKLPTQSGPATVTLAASANGQVYIVEANSDGGTHTITIAITGGTVNGSATITSAYGRRIVTCDGTNAISQ